MPLVWLDAARSQLVDRVYGPDLMLAIFGATQHAAAAFLLRGAPGVAEE